MHGVSSAVSVFDVRSGVQLGDSQHTPGGAWEGCIPLKDRAKLAVAPHHCWCADWKWCLLDLRCLPSLAHWRRRPPMPPCCLPPVSPVRHHRALRLASWGVSVSVTGSSCRSVSPLLRTSVRSTRSGMHL